MTETTTREGSSPKRPPGVTAYSAGSESAAPDWPRMHASASATSRPPSAQSCADASSPSLAARTSSDCSAASAARSMEGGRPHTLPVRRVSHSLPPRRSSPRGPSTKTWSPAVRNPAPTTSLTFSKSPTAPMVGVGSTARGPPCSVVSL